MPRPLVGARHRWPDITYDGAVAPDGGEPGVEDPAARVASPRADAEGHGGTH
ncbi:hypothetical protein ACLQ3D_32410 [Micromonospora vinacea]|uniref:Uncharacterized protein n=1 Tax=Micromonospora vinacea TaxID=709878 RepID=A0ABS0JUR9_9ACTN|nr:hypothetical protein [Micromonospora vinacea]MBG6100110.1 hypothetical protein [Micromonospora vinacea]WSZ76920.1 hypothetical protein OH804_34660 [Micromonospora sp. NBC_00860]WTA66604.1 hypothetical protein OHB51_29715 [Micromonospora sp. NBC_00855]